MAAMRRGLVHLLAWLLATGAAVTLSWWGVHTVMAGTAYDPPRALPISAGDATAQGSKSLATATARPEASPSTSGRGGNRSKAPTPSASASPTAKPGPSPSPSASGQVKSYDTEGGRAVFSLEKAYATLVSATPAAGWSMQVWKTETWIRVEFASGAERVSVFCTWHDSAPRVDINDY
jgi:hypothetical protein